MIKDVKDNYIDPSTRFSPVDNWFKTCVMYHSKRYNYLTTPSIPSSPLLLDAEVGCTETHKRIVENYFKGTRMFINIGAAGAVSDKPKIGDVVEATTVIPTAGLARVLTDRVTLLNRSHWDVPEVITQCVPTLYYNKDFLIDGVDCVEQESEAVAATCIWLNHNYGDKYGMCDWANLFYISDIVEDGWKDTLKLQEQRNEYRRKVLEVALT